MPDRPSIPAEVERTVFTEAGHRCAVCGESVPLERAHIISWSRSKDHSAENLVCLCANCHERADRERWGELVLREYKARPWILRRLTECHATAGPGVTDVKSGGGGPAPSEWPSGVLMDPDGEKAFLQVFRMFAIEQPWGIYRDRCGLGPLSFPSTEIAYDDPVIAQLTTKRGLEVEKFVRNGGIARFILTRVDLVHYQPSVHNPRQLAVRFDAVLERLTAFAGSNLIQTVLAPRPESFSEAILGDRLLIRASKHPDQRQFYRETDCSTDQLRISHAIVQFDNDFEHLRDGRSYDECNREIIAILKRNLQRLER